MHDRRLLERIASLGDEDELATRESRAERLIQSILNHLQRILNTRQGSAPIDAEFGVPDFTNLAGSFSAGSTDQIIENLSRMIRRYEPRLLNAQIVLTDSQDEVLSLAFLISGVIRIDNREIPIRMNSHVSSNGQILLRRQ